MSYSILLVVERPDLQIPENEKKWDDCRNKIINISTKYTNLQALGENVLLLTMQNSLKNIRDAVNCLDGMDYKYALFDTEILWHEVSKDS
ncbi:MAG: hypothetical protein LWX51_02450 [Deltaproteobacteria bacterium]|jgi:hypothetical protein|nr:hypothetical protein [Deltaproteobacteria bacterium]